MKQVLGGILLAIGILIAGASGLCSLVMLFESGPYGGSGMIVPVLIFGGIPFLIGAGMAVGGYALVRSARNEREDGA